MKCLNQKGQAIVEFCIVLPLICFLLIGMMEFGLILYDKAVITNAAREGARAGIVSQTPRMTEGEIRTIVSDYCEDHLIGFGSTVSPTVDIVVPTNPQYGDPLSVTANYSYGFLVLPNFLLGSGDRLALSSRAVMRYE